MRSTRAKEGHAVRRVTGLPIIGLMIVAAPPARRRSRCRQESRPRGGRAVTVTGLQLGCNLDATWMQLGARHNLHEGRKSCRLAASNFYVEAQRPPGRPDGVGARASGSAE